MGDLIPKPNTQGKIAQTDYDFWLTQSEDTCLYCLSPRQIAILLTALPMSEWRTRWFSPTGAEPDMDLIRAEIAKIETELMTSHCDLETAINNINTQITTINSNITTINASLTVVNNSLTLIENNVTNIDIEVKNVITQNTNIDIEVKNVITQNTNINIVNVITTFVSFSANVDDNTNAETYARYNALCAGLNDWVYSQCYRVASANGVSAFGLDTIIAGLTIGVNVIEGLIHTDNPGAYSATDLENAFTSAADMEAVTCHMVTYLSLLPMTFDNFKNSLTTFTPANAYQTTIAITLQAALTYYDAFTAFVMNQQSEFQIALAANPTDFICLSCTPLNFCSIPQSWDFTLLQFTPWIVTRGGKDSALGIVGVQIDGDLQFGYDVSIYFPTPCVGLATHHVHFFVSQQSPGGNAYTIEWYYLLAGVPTRYNQSNVASVATYPTIEDLSTVAPTPPGGAGIYRIRWYTNTPYYGNATSHNSAAAKLTKITFTT